MFLKPIISNICVYYQELKINFNTLISSISVRIHRIAFPVFSKPFFPEIAATDREMWKKISPVLTNGAQSDDLLSSLLSQDTHSEILGWLFPYELRTTALVCKVWLARERTYLNTFKTHLINSKYTSFLEGQFDIPVNPMNSKLLVEKFCPSNWHISSEKVRVKLRDHCKCYMETSEPNLDFEDLLHPAFCLKSVDDNSGPFISNILRKNLFDPFFYREDDTRVHFSFKLTWFFNLSPQLATFTAEEFLTWMDCHSLQKINKKGTLMFYNPAHSLPSDWFFQNFQIKLLSLPKEITRLNIQFKLAREDFTQTLAIIDANPQLEMLILNLSNWSDQERSQYIEALNISSIKNWELVVGYEPIQPTYHNSVSPKPIIVTKKDFPT